MEKFNGGFGIFITPYKKNGDIDYNNIEVVCEKLCATNTQGIVLNGSTSEFPFHTFDENIEIMKTAKNIIGKRKKIIGGATSPDNNTTIKYLREMAKLEFDGALIAPPYYFKYSDTEIKNFYEKISINNYGVPIIAYSIPAFTNSISMATYLNLLEMPNIVGLKNSSQNIKDISHQVNFKNEIRPDFKILTGTDDCILACLISGCTGSFTAFGNILPNEIELIYSYYNESNISAAIKVQDSILPLLRLCDKYSFPIGYKLFAEVLGLENKSYKQDISKSDLDSFENTRKEMYSKYIKMQNEVKNI